MCMYGRRLRTTAGSCDGQTAVDGVYRVAWRDAGAVLTTSSQVAESDARRLPLLRGEDRNHTRRERREGGTSVSGASAVWISVRHDIDSFAMFRACRAADPNAVVPPPIRRKDRPSKPNGLTKQTYSVTVHLPGSGQPRKWHVVAYFSVSSTTLPLRVKLH